MIRRSALAAAAIAIALPAAAQDGSWRTPDLDDRILQRLFRGQPAGAFVERRAAEGATDFYTRARPGSGWLCEADRLRVVSIQDRSGRLIRRAAVQTVYRSPPSGGCRSLGRGVAYFAAPDSDTADLAVEALQAVLRSRRSRSRPLFNTECDPDCDFLLDLDNPYPAIRGVQLSNAGTPGGPASRITVRLAGPGSGYEVSATFRAGPDPLRQRILHATARALP